MRKVLLATAAVAALGFTATNASADYWTTANINYGSVDGDIKVGYASIRKNSTMSVGNMGALTVNDNEENVDVTIKGPVVEINVDQKAGNLNGQLTHNSIDQSNSSKADTDAKAGAAAGAVAIAGAKASADGDAKGYLKAETDNDALALAGAAAGAAAGAVAKGGDVDVDQANRAHQSNDNENYQRASNFSAIYVEDQLGGLLDCGCSTDDFYTMNVNMARVDGDIYAHKLDVSYGSTVSVGNIGAATINKSTNNLNIEVGKSHGHRR